MNYSPDGQARWCRSFYGEMFGANTYGHEIDRGKIAGTKQLRTHQAVDPDDPGVPKIRFEGEQFFVEREDYSFGFPVTIEWEKMAKDAMSGLKQRFGTKTGGRSAVN